MGRLWNGTRTRAPRAALSMLLLAMIGTASAQQRAPKAQALAKSAQAALDAGQPTDAIAPLREALAISPADDALRRMLADALRRQNNFDAALKEYDALVQRAPGDAALRLDRAFLRQARGQHRDAMDDFQAATTAGLSPETEVIARYGWADSALAANDAAAALQAISSLPDSEGHRLHARRAVAHERAGELAAAVDDWVKAEAASSDATERDFARRSQAQLRERIAHAAEGQAPVVNPHLEAAYSAVRAHDDARALSEFEAAGSDIPPLAALDAGYAAKRAGRNEAAVQWFSRGIDRWHEATGPKPFDDKTLFGVRRENEELARKGGGSLALFYRNAALVPGVSNGDVLQFALEGYVQPAWGHHNGRAFQAFAQVIGTLDQPGSVNTGDTLLGSVGVRWKPFGQQGLILTAQRLIGLGDLVDDDWMLRVGYSHDIGTDMQPWHGSWTYNSVFAEAAYLVDAKRTLGTLQWRVGRSYGMGEGGRFVLTPHAVLAAEHDSAAIEESAVGAGVGVNARWWFHEDRHHAPARYVDFNVQYRTRIGGSERIDGIAAYLILRF